MTILTKIKIAIFCAVVLLAALLTLRVSNLKKENQRLQNNHSVLLAKTDALYIENQKYKVADSLSAIKVDELRLTLEEYKKYRAEDLALISKLRVDKKELQKIIDVQAENLLTLSAPLRDTILIFRDTSQYVKAFSYESEWIDVNGLVNLETDQVDLAINNRESLIVVESVTYKRFLGFLWKTKNIKSRSVDIVSRNPHTEIIEANYESIEALR